jgi:hypothetical protein
MHILIIKKNLKKGKGKKKIPEFCTGLKIDLLKLVWERDIVFITLASHKPAICSKERHHLLSFKVKIV